MSAWYAAMVHHSRRLWLVALVFAFTIAPFPVSAGPQDDVLGAETALNAAIVRHDTAVIEKLIAPDYTLTLPDGTVYENAAFLSLAGNAKMVYTVDQAHDQHVRLYGESTAIITGILDIRGTFGTQPVSLSMRYTDTWVKKGGAWVQVAGHSSNLKH